MKIKTITKVVETEIYVAEDGTEFDSGEACADYEITKMEESMELYDYDFDKSDFDGFVYANIRNQTEVEYFHELCRYYGVRFKNGITGPGIWLYADNDFINIGEAVDFMRNK